MPIKVTAHSFYSAPHAAQSHAPGDRIIYDETTGALYFDARAHSPAVEFAVLDTGQPAPGFLGATFQREEEFGVFGLHAWVWRDNPNGLFAETNPRVSCGA